MNIALRFSQLNGLISSLFDGANSIVKNIISIFTMVLYIPIYKLFVVPIAVTIDAIQMVFRKFAGLDTYVFEGNVQSGDVVLSLINNSTVQNVFWSLVILAVVLLFITTVAALIRAQTQSSDDKGRKTNNQIFVTAFKALLNFFMVPVVAILGVFMGNALLRSLDGATSGGGTYAKVSGMLFSACAYDCNRARMSTTFAEDLANGLNDMGVLKGTPEDIADVVDQAFKNTTQFDDWHSFAIGDGWNNMFADFGEYSFMVVMYINGAADITGSSLVPRYIFSIYDMWEVFYYYDLTSFNYLLYIVASLFVIWVLVTTSVGLIKRFFKVATLLVVSPPIAALMPLDGGTALGKWRQQFIGSTLSAYGTIVAFNLTMLLFGPVSEIKFFYFPGTNYSAFPFNGLNQIIQVLILVATMIFFKDFTKSLSGIIGAEDAHEAGANATKNIAKKVAKVAATIASSGAAAAAMKGAGAAAATGKALLAAKNKAGGTVDALQNKIDGLKDGDPEKLQAQQDLEKAKKVQEEANKEYNDQMPDIEKAQKEYSALADKHLAKVKENAFSVATNGLSDDFSKAGNERREMDKKTISDSSRDLKKKLLPSRKSKRQQAKADKVRNQQDSSYLAQNSTPGELLEIQKLNEEQLANPDLMTSSERKEAERLRENIKSAIHIQSVNRAVDQYSTEELRAKLKENKSLAKDKTVSQYDRDMAKEAASVAKEAIKRQEEIKKEKEQAEKAAKQAKPTLIDKIVLSSEMNKNINKAKKNQANKVKK